MNSSAFFFLLVFIYFLFCSLFTLLVLHDSRDENTTQTTRVILPYRVYVQRNPTYLTILHRYILHCKYDVRILHMYVENVTTWNSTRRTIFSNFLSSFIQRYNTYIMYTAYYGYDCVIIHVRRYLHMYVHIMYPIRTIRTLYGMVRERDRLREKRGEESKTRRVKNENRRAERARDEKRKKKEEVI